MNAAGFWTLIVLMVALLLPPTSSAPADALAAERLLAPESLVDADGAKAVADTSGPSLSVAKAVVPLTSLSGTPIAAPLLLPPWVPPCVAWRRHFLTSRLHGNKYI